MGIVYENDSRAMKVQPAQTDPWSTVLLLELGSQEDGSFIVS